MTIRRDPQAGFARALAFEEAIWSRVTEEQEPFRWGTGFFTPELSDIWDANFLRLEDPDDDLSVDALIAEAEQVMGRRGLAHRKIVVNDRALGEALAPGFDAAGWEVSRLLYMLHRGDAPAASDVAVDEVVEAVHAAAKDEFNRRNPRTAGEDVVAQMRGLGRRVSAATDKRRFAAYAGDEIASVCELYSDGLTAQIEDVGTLEEHRKKGLATAVVLRALQEAQSWGHEMIFLVADDEDWPKQMYAKLGFEEAGRTYQFLLKPPQ